MDAHATQFVAASANEALTTQGKALHSQLQWDAPTIPEATEVGTQPLFNQLLKSVESAALLTTVLQVGLPVTVMPMPSVAGKGTK